MECEEITEKIIGAFFKVFEEIGYGFKEKVYVGAVKIELDKIGLKSVRELPIKVKYDGNVVGEYMADLLVENHQLSASVQGVIRGATVIKSYPVGDTYTTELSLDFKNVYDIYLSNQRKSSIKDVKYY